ncbi:helix-turn-helix transcriptional regulator [Streptomyces sp. OUCMDZ-4982]|uniref:helix-turn-helix domain-containing protein n=1 Tax=Streptomyces sp. OUCMDZ-4982 TaxID=2973090 RepID=UPI00215D2F6A|nr:helix-turn-helix transcriptional regulator [Streptomyces sp. OUCMDZ-4982]MCR8944095.1 helix-turn-helix transcriptional regulator [Streptomyces sp. OUCMDZ-4982]
MSKRALALAMGFDPSYVSHVEPGRHKPSEEFSRLADEALDAGKAIWRRWCDYEQAKARTRRPAASPPAQRRPEQPYATGSALVVEHDAARLQYDGSNYRLTMRRRHRRRADHPLPDPDLRQPLPRRPRAIQHPLQSTPVGLERARADGHLPG